MSHVNFEELGRVLAVAGWGRDVSDAKDEIKKRDNQERCMWLLCRAVAVLEQINERARNERRFGRLKPEHPVSDGMHHTLNRHAKVFKRLRIVREVRDAARALLASADPPRLTAAMLGGYSTDPHGLNGIANE